MRYRLFSLPMAADPLGRHFAAVVGRFLEVVCLVVEDAPPPGHRFNSPPLVVRCPAVGIRSHEDGESLLHFRHRDTGKVGESRDRAFNHPIPVLHRQHGDPHADGGMVLAPNGRGHDGREELGVTCHEVLRKWRGVGRYSTDRSTPPRVFCGPGPCSQGRHCVSALIADILPG